MHFIYYDSIDSTNKEAVRLIRAGKIPSFPAVILADKQTDGKGRYDRSWQAPEGNLSMSIIHPGNDSRYSFVAACAVINALKHTAISENIPLQPRTKWPNDILLNEKKVAGILVQSVSDDNLSSNASTPPSSGMIYSALLSSVTPAQETSAYMVIGIGANIKAHPNHTQYPSTHLHEAGLPITKEALCDAIIQEYIPLQHAFETEGFDIIREAWLADFAFLNKEITVSDPHSDSITGVMETMDHSGALLLKTKNNSLTRVMWGDSS